tara:strand:- start:89 stop:247 length:159 start_codon:yes stop_codon:yes gene_type:complete
MTTDKQKLGDFGIAPKLYIKVNMKTSYDTNVTHYFETLLNRGFQRCSTIEWE